MSHKYTFQVLNDTFTMRANSFEQVMNRLQKRTPIGAEWVWLCAKLVRTT